MSQELQSEAEGRTDCREVLDFLFQRIEDQASRSSVLLDESARELLEFPPESSGGSFHGMYTTPAPRNRDYEEFLKLTKESYAFDRSADHALDQRWRFAYAVLKFNGRSTARFLELAGVRVRGSFLDALLTFASGLLVVIGLVSFQLARVVVRWVFAFQLLTAFCGALLLVFFFWSRGLSKAYWKEQIEKLRST
jgi:hypothetical protein